MSSSSKKFARTLIGTLLLAGPAFCQATISILSGNGQIVLQNNTGSNPLVVVVRDAAGNPIPNSKVTWSISGVQNQTGSLLLASTTTDATGTTGGGCATGGTGGCQKFVTPTLPPGNNGFAQSTITATSGSASVSFIETTEGVGSSGAALILANIVHPTPAEQPLTGPAGQQAKTPIQIRVISSVSNGPVPHVLVTVTSDASSQTSAACSGGNPMTDSTGVATCNLILGGKASSSAATLTVDVGGVVGQNLSEGLGTFSISYKVLIGPPGVIKTVSGDQQTGNPGQLLPQALVAQVTDLGGNPLPGVSLVYEPVVAGTVTLSDVRATSDSLGHVSARATPGNVNGQVLVRVRTSDGTVSATFLINVNLIVGSLTKISGDQQTPAIVGTAFADPLTVQVNDTSGHPLPGTPVTFAVTSGSATLGTTNATTNGLGQAGTTLSAGATAGAIVVTATVTTASGPVSVQFNLTSRLRGPQCIDGQTFVNGASFKANWISPGSVVTIYCSGIADNIQGVVMPSFFGPLPYQIAGVSVTFGSTPAPIFDVANINGMESVTVEVPIEAAVGGDSVTITANDGSTTVNATILESAPGFFETGDVGPDGRRMAVVLRPDGSVVSATNPILRGEIGRAFVTGLIAPAGLGTDALSPIDSDIEITSGVVVGINNRGVPTVSVKYARNVVGIWEVQFMVPQTATPGLRDPFALAMITASGKRVYTQPSTIPVQ